MTHRDDQQHSTGILKTRKRSYTNQMKNCLNEFLSTGAMSIVWNIELEELCVDHQQERETNDAI